MLSKDERSREAGEGGRSRSIPKVRPLPCCLKAFQRDCRRCDFNSRGLNGSFLTKGQLPGSGNALSGLAYYAPMPLFRLIADC